MIGPAPLRVRVVHTGQHVTVRLVGELDMSSASTLADSLHSLTDAGSVRLLLDLSGLAFCDSTGVSQFVAAAERCTDAGGWLRLAAPQPQLLRVLQVAGLLPALATYPTVTAAVKGGQSTRLLDSLSL
jgi:anti-sigma B factor antagonist